MCDISISLNQYKILIHVAHQKLIEIMYDNFISVISLYYMYHLAEAIMHIR